MDLDEEWEAFMNNGVSSLSLNNREENQINPEETDDNSSHYNTYRDNCEAPTPGDIYIS